MIELVIDSFAGGGLFRFDALHSTEEGGVVVVAIRPSVHSSMAIRAEGNYETDIVGSSIADPSYVMGLKVGGAVRAEERGSAAASFTTTVGAPKHIGAHISAAGVDSALAGSCDLADAGSSDRGIAEFLEGAGIWFRSVCFLRLFNVLDRAELENECGTHGAIAIGRGSGEDIFANPLSLEAQAAVLGDFSKKEKGFAIAGMLSDRSIPTRQLHISDLALAVVFEDAVFPEAIGVAVLPAFVSGDDDHDRVASGSNDAALLLTAKFAVHVAPSVVGAPALKAPRHHAFIPTRLPAEPELSQACWGCNRRAWQAAQLSLFEECGEVMRPLLVELHKRVVPLHPCGAFRDRLRMAMMGLRVRPGPSRLELDVPIVPEARGAHLNNLKCVGGEIDQGEDHLADLVADKPSRRDFSSLWHRHRSPRDYCHHEMGHVLLSSRGAA
ncbi:UNVERIFIED_ORG: hypothetical protein ABID33_000238 [Xanthobacter viscosus]